MTTMIQRRSRLVSVAGLTLEADSLDQFNGDHVYLGDDWTDVVKACHKLPGGRHLDVGTGSGIILLACAQNHTQSVGVDINPRAIEMARVNARQNGIAAEFHHADIFTTSFEPFDLVTWSTPFMFVPEEKRDWWAGYGGKMGIGITLKFLERLPALLTPKGHAVLESASPILRDGTDVLARDILPVVKRTGLDVTMTPIKVYWDPWNRTLHQAHQVRYFIRVLLHVTHGHGQFTHRAPTVIQRMLDGLRWFKHCLTDSHSTAEVTPRAWRGER
jgi:SAM-dependent methyltransferase